jgi:hypothetical protein
MKMKAKESFTWYPDGKTPSVIVEGQEFEVESQADADLLAAKKHAEKVAGEASWRENKGGQK